MKLGQGIVVGRAGVVRGLKFFWLVSHVFKNKQTSIEQWNIYFKINQTFLKALASYCNFQDKMLELNSIDIHQIKKSCMNKRWNKIRSWSSREELQCPCRENLLPDRVHIFHGTGTRYPGYHNSRLAGHRESASLRRAQWSGAAGKGRGQNAASSMISEYIK